MALMLGRLYDAVVAGGTPPNEAREATEQVTAFGRRLRRQSSWPP